LEQAFQLFGQDRDLFGHAIEPRQGVLAKRFTWPPFSILDGRSGEWQRRKRQWISLGIESYLGRTAQAFGDCSQCQARNVLPGGGGPNSIMRRIPAAGEVGQHQTSIFDPVLAELCYRWFAPTGGLILDPTAGGSTRGVVASLLGFRYHGIELRQEQVDANIVQAQRICTENFPVWVCADALQALTDAPPCDFIFSCPPFFNLEIYSDDERDLSGMPDYESFLEKYRAIIARCANKLKANSFAAFVVSNIRDKRTGNYHNLVGDTVMAFRDAGCGFFNEAVFIQPCGSLPIRVAGQFENSKKLGRSHQTLLVFKKGR
jgi:DNA modification methylase